MSVRLLSLRIVSVAGLTARPKLDIKDYATYNLGDNLPREVFGARTATLIELVRTKYPSDYAHTLAPLIFFLALMLSTVATLSMIVLGRDNIPLVLEIVVPVFALLTLFFGSRRQLFLKNVYKEFDTQLNTTLKEFTTLDLPTYSVKWVCRNLNGQYHPYSIELYQVDPEVGEEGLPAYAVEYDETAILASDPPQYEALELDDLPVEVVQIRVENGADAESGAETNERSSLVGEMGIEEAYRPEMAGRVYSGPELPPLYRET